MLVEHPPITLSSTEDHAATEYAVVKRKRSIGIPLLWATRNDGDQHISAKGNPDMRLHGALAGARKRLDALVTCVLDHDTTRSRRSFVLDG